jgi:hypothetical protein
MKRLLNWYKIIRETGSKRISKYIFIYGIYIFIIWTFDYLYAPWLAIKYKQFVFFPLYFSLFIVSLVGLYIYNFFNEDMFFREKIKKWLAEKGKWKITHWIKTKINSSPQVTFAIIATWWSPLHAYVYFRDEDEKNILAIMKSLGLGSFYCSLFWGVIANLLLLLWELGKKIYQLYL